MARRGSFTAPTEHFGAPLALVHPIDNKFPKYDPEVDALEGLTDEQKRKIQQKIDELFGALVLGSQEPPPDGS